jgi:hypothetical protein
MIKQVGKHQVKHGSLTQGIDDLMKGHQVDVLYSDPPWGQGNISYWQTMNEKDTGKEREPKIELDTFLNVCFSTYQKYAKNLLFLEYGTKWVDMILDKATMHGFECLATITTEYASGSKWYPLHLHILAKNPTAEMREIASNQAFLKTVEGTHGYDTLRKVTQPFLTKGLTYLDPMCGMGYTAQLAIDNEGTFYGNELNAKRLQKTITRLEKDPTK